MEVLEDVGIASDGPQIASDQVGQEALTRVETCRTILGEAVTMLADVVFEGLQDGVRNAARVGRVARVILNI